MNDSSSSHIPAASDAGEAATAEATTPEISPRTRAILIAVTVVIGVVVASIPLIAGLQGSNDDHGAPVASEQNTDATTSQPEHKDVQVGHQVACPKGAGEFSPQSELARIQLPCLTTGGKLGAEKAGPDVQGSASLAAAVAGKPTVINVWAWWCGPCRTELPIMEQLREKHPEYNVVGVHLDPKAQAGADMLRDLKVQNFPSYQDSSHTFDAAGKLPKVVPLTLVYHPDGTRAKLIPKAFDNLEELEREVGQALRNPALQDSPEGAR